MRLWICYIFVSLVKCGAIAGLENLELEKTCGRHFHTKYDSFKSYGGRQLQIYEYPWLAALKIRGVIICSGVLISFKHVLTAAHCLLETNTSVTDAKTCSKMRHRNSRQLVGLPYRWSILVNSECVDLASCKSGWVTPREFFLHEDYDECTHTNDLALFELTSNVSRRRGMPICMPAKALRITRKLKAIGSGVEGSAESNDDSNLSTNGNQMVNLYFMRSENRQIISAAPPGVGICRGDSGGPLFQTSSADKITLVGIMSYGVTCKANYGKPLPTSDEWNPCVEELPAIDYFTDIRKNLEWICQKSGVCPLKSVDVKNVADETNEDVCSRVQSSFGSRIFLYDRELEFTVVLAVVLFVFTIALVVVLLVCLNGEC